MKVSMFVAAALLAGSMTMAADMENKDQSTVDTSKNPITGTVTEKKKHTKKKKDGNGEATQTTTDTTKTHKDGTVEHKTETKTDSTDKH